MTVAPNLNPARITAAMWRLWTEFDAHAPKTRLGGIYDPKPGYHNARNALPSWDYSRQYPADLRGPGDKAAAIDLTFPDAQAGDFATIIRYTKRLDAAARAHDPRLYLPDGTPVLREFIGTLNGRVPYAYDLQRGKSDTDRDDSHLWHIHLSVTRAFVADWDALVGILSVLKGDSIMALTRDDMKTMMLWDPGDDTGVGNWSWRGDFATNKTVQARYAWWLAPEEAHGARVEAAAARADIAAQRQLLIAILAAVKDDADVAAIIGHLDDGLAALRTDLIAGLAPQLIDALRAGLADGVDDDALTAVVETAVRNVFGSLDKDDAPTG